MDLASFCLRSHSLYGAGVFPMGPDALRGELIGLIIPIPIALGESDIPGLFHREVGLDPPHLFQLVYMPGYIGPIIGMLAAGVDWCAVLQGLGGVAHIGIVYHERKGPRGTF